MNEKLIHRVLGLIRKLDNARDLRWLVEELHARVDPDHYAQLHGIPGGHEGYSRSDELYAVVDLLPGLPPDDLLTAYLVSDMLYDLLSPVAGDSRGTVQLKTIKKRYPVIDWQETGKTGITTFIYDEHGQKVMADFYYTYCYVRQYAGRGDETRKRAQLLSLYADRGMGKGGTGGYVAAALDEGIVTEDDILDAWHGGETVYSAFIDQCADLVGKPEGSEVELGSDAKLPNSTDSAPMDQPTAQAAVQKPTAMPSTVKPSVDLSEHARRLLGVFAFTLNDETGKGVLHWRKNSASWKTDKAALGDLEKAGFVVHLEAGDAWDVYYKITEAGIKAER